MIELYLDSEAVAELRFDTPGEKVNLLSVASLNRLSQLLDELAPQCAAGKIRAVLLTSAKKGVFVAGADVKGFVEVTRAGDRAAASTMIRYGQKLFDRIATLPVPTVAAVNGACLGGGLELALACAARVAGDSTDVTMGLPEVRLGIIPGWGGTQRLPRLLGVSRALDLILTGRSLTARQALKIGLVDAVAPPEGILAAARGEALKMAAGHGPRRPAWSLMDRNPATRALVFQLARRKAAAQTNGHYPAPLAAIEAVRASTKLPLKEGFGREAELVLPLLFSDVSRNLVRIFLDSRSGGTEAAAPAAARVERIGVLGAGTMGGGIAAVAAVAGVPVRLKDVSAEALARGMKQVRSLASSAARKGKLPRHEAALRESLVTAATDMRGFARCDLVVEAVVEDLGIKRAVLAEVEAATGPSCIFASNTSSLSVAAIASGAARPGRVVGLHFFNPVEKMPLVEVVRAPASEDDAVAGAAAIARKMGKTVVIVKDTPGFIVNRILMPYLAGAMQLLINSRGALDIRGIDAAMTRFGMPMGPFTLLDQIGLDVAAKVAGVLRAAFPDRPGDPRLLEAMQQAGLLGVKSGRGFYQYTQGKGSPKRAAPSPELTGLLAALSSGGAPGPAGPAPAPDAADIADSLVDAMVNEAAWLLGDGAVEGPAVIDIAMIFGTGFPPFRGGLLRHADAVGPRRITERLAARGQTTAPLLASTERFYT